MTTKDFLKIENVRMIWDVISDEELFRFLSQDMQVKVYQLFQSNLQGFYETERVRTSSLVELNKRYILLVLRYIKDQMQVLPSKIRIHQEEQRIIPVKELVTFEEIQKEKQSQFDRDLSQRQQEFEGYMTINPPEQPSFADQTKDQPIQEMDKILKEMQLQRNYEIEQIRTYNTNPSDASNWLTPQETSIKSPPKKNVTFAIDQLPTLEDRQRKLEELEQEDQDLLFSKLKKVVAPPNINEREKQENELRFSLLEREVSVLHQKLDKILSILQN